MSLSGHFPWLMRIFKGFFSYTEMGKALDYVSKVALDLIKARRQGGHTEKVHALLSVLHSSHKINIQIA